MNLELHRFFAPAYVHQTSIRLQQRYSLCVWIQINGVDGSALPRTPSPGQSIILRLLRHHHHHHRGPRQPHHTLTTFALLVLYWASGLLAWKIVKASVGVILSSWKFEVPLQLFFKLSAKCRNQIFNIHTVNGIKRERFLWCHSRIPAYPSTCRCPKPLNLFLWHIRPRIFQVLKHVHTLSGKHSR